MCTYSWDRKSDRFTPGQWLRGRIFERRSDLSPDGRYMIYFAMNGKWSSETRGSWTAVSRAPWLKAVVLFGKGDCWNGGGLFTWKSNYWLNGGYGDFPIRESRDDYEVRRDLGFEPPRLYGDECLGVYYVRLQRDGWVLKERRRASDRIAVFEKPLSHGWVLRKYAHETIEREPGRGCYW
ncbi:MAG: hypothetical protein ACRD8O_06000, partial [Bryobacteraceae bacterium]